MLKNLRSITKIMFLFFILLGGCSSHTARPTVPMTVFNPSPGMTFNVKATLFDLNGNGVPQKIESGVVPVEQAAIRALESIGYHYTPSGDVNYLIEARIGSISPKLAAQGASQHVGIAVDSFSGWPAFNEYPVIVNEWSPEIQRIKSGPDSCFITMQILIKEVKQQRDDVIYHGTPRPIEVPYALGCPFSICGAQSAEKLRDYLTQLFSHSIRN